MLVTLVAIEKFFVLLHECFLVRTRQFSLRAFMALLNGHAPLILAQLKTHTQSGKYWQNFNPHF